MSTRPGPLPPVTGGPGASARRRRRHVRREQRALRVGLTATAVALPVMLLVAWVAFQTPTTSLSDAEHAPLAHELRFEYTAFAHEPSIVYPEAQVGPVRQSAGDEDEGAAGAEAGGAGTSHSLPVDTPEAEDGDVPARTERSRVPLYAGLIERVDVTVAYLPTGEQVDVSGTYSAELRIATPEGWTTSSTVVPPEPFAGDAHFTVPIDLAEAQATIAAVSEHTGMGGGAYTLELVPAVTVTGTAGAEPIDEVVTHPFAIAVSGGLLQPPDVLRHTIVDADSVQVVVRNELELLGMSLPVDRLRTATVTALAVLLAVATWLAHRRWGRHEATRIGLLYRSRLVQVSAYEPLPLGHTVPVATFRELHRLARRDERMILHQAVGDGRQRYFVPDGDVTYEYVVRDPAGDDGHEALDRLDAYTGAGTHDDADPRSGNSGARSTTLNGSPVR